MPKPTYKKSHKAWYLILKGKPIRLGKTKKEADKRYHEIMAEGGEVGPDITVKELFKLFIEHLMKNHAESTLKWHDGYMDRFLKYVGNVKVSDLRKHHFTQWLDHDCPLTTNKDTTRNSATRAVKRAFSWGLDQELIASNPFRAVKAPKASPRQSEITPEQFGAFLAASGELHDVLQTFWQTGCRPMELRTVEARWVSDRAWRFPVEGMSPKLKGRIVLLNDTALEITMQHCEKYPEGPIFRNSRGLPWTARALSQRFSRLSKKTGIKFVPYDNRHSFGTRYAKAGESPLLVATLMGHADTRMLSQVYAHINKDAPEVRDCLERL